MNQVVRAKCPGCQKVLRIPAAWVKHALRCKHCGMVVQAKGMATSAPVAAAPAAILAQPAGTVVRPAAPPGADAPGSPADPAPFVFEEPYAGLSSYRRRTRHSKGKLAAAAIALVLLVGTGVWAWQTAWRPNALAALWAKKPPTQELSSTTAGDTGPKPAPPTDLPNNSGDFPRRALAVSVNNYWYANPVAYGDSHRGVGAVLRRVAEALYIPKDQVFELSDGGSAPVPCTKEVIQNTVTDFLNTSRAQDRILLLFVGHAVEVGGEPYLVPIDGALLAKDTLIPLKWLYDGLARCKARQKVLIMDLCRFDPSRGLERPGSGPMKAKIDAALRNPPPGVQVWSACAAKQYSYEGTLYTADTSGLNVGFFLSELYEAVGTSQKKVVFGIQRAGDPLPVDMLANGKGQAPGVNRGTEHEADYWVAAKQTPRLSGREEPGGAPYDPQEKPPAPVVIRKPAPPPGGAVAGRVVKEILDETGALASREGSPPLMLATLPAFDAKVLEAYKDDGKRTSLRQAVLKAKDLLAKHSQTFQEEFRGRGDDAAVKKLIYDRQKPPAQAMEELKEAMEDLQNLREESGKDKSRRWQADYELVLARLEQRFAYANEYNYMLGRIRKDALPPRDPNKYGGWRLAAQEKLHPQIGKEGKEMAADARKRFLKLAKSYPGTPWAFLGKREALAALGLEWQVTP